MITKKKFTSRFIDNKFCRSIHIKNKSLKNMVNLDHNNGHKIIACFWCAAIAILVFVFGIFFNLFVGITPEFFTEDTQKSVISSLLLAKNHIADSAYKALLEPCLFFKTEQNEIFLRSLNTAKSFENTVIGVPLPTDIFVSFESFCTYFSMFHDFVSTEEFKQIVFHLPAGKINFCLLLRECFLNDPCWADLPKTYKIIICSFIDILELTDTGQLYFINKTGAVDIFFNLRTMQEAFTELKEIILSIPAICNSEQSESEIKEFFYKFEFYLNHMQSHEISYLGLSEFTHRLCSVVYTTRFSIEWILFFSDTIEIYILWNWLPWSIAFIITVYLCFRPNTLFHIPILPTLPTANYFFVPLYICILIWLLYR